MQTYSVLKSDDLDEEELTIGFVGCEKWFSEMIQQGLFKSTNEASKATFRDWVGNQLKSFISILCYKSRDIELSDLIFQLLIRFYLLEVDEKTKIIEKTRIVRTISAHLCDFDNDKTDEIEKFCDFLTQPNILIDLTNAIRDILEQSSDRNEVLSKNIIFYLESVTQVFPNEEMDK